jgi:hypothetical protein
MMTRTKAETSHLVSIKCCVWRNTEQIHLSAFRWLVVPSSSHSSSPTRGSSKRDTENEDTTILWNVDSALYPSRRHEISSIDVRTSNNADITITDKTINLHGVFPLFLSYRPIVGLPKILLAYLKHVASNSEHCGILFFNFKNKIIAPILGDTATVWTTARIVRRKVLILRKRILLRHQQKSISRYRDTVVFPNQPSVLTQ